MSLHRVSFTAGAIASACVTCVLSVLLVCLSYVGSSYHSGVFGNLTGVPCACAHLRNLDFVRSAVLGKRK